MYGLSLSNPALLFGLLAIGLPVVIHLLLRPRPRRVRFPALRLLAPVAAVGRRASRIRNLKQLLVRCALVGAAAVLLAGPSCAPRSSASDGETGTEPVAGVFILDDSLSLTYAVDEQRTRLDEARELLAARLRESAAWPAGSVVAAVSAGAAEDVAPLSINVAAAAARIEAPAEAMMHARPLGAAIHAAAELLRGAKLRRRHVVIATDLAAHAWRDVQRGEFGSDDGLAVEVIFPPSSDRRDMALLDCQAPPVVLSPRAAVPIHAVIRSAGTAGSAYLSARSGKDVLVRAGPFELTADAPRDLEVLLPPRGDWARGVEVVLEPADRMMFNQQQYVAIRAGEVPLVWLVLPVDPAAREDPGILILRNLLAPETLSEEQQLVNLKLMEPAELPSTTAMGTDPLLIVVFNDTPLQAAQRDAILARVERGATLLLAPRSSGLDADWPMLRELVSRTAPQRQEERTAIARPRAPGSDLAASAFDELAQCTVLKRLRMSELVETARAVAQYVDGAAAIVERKVERGRVLVLTTSPDPAWSELGLRAAGLLTWLHSLLAEAESAAPLRLVAGEASRAAMPGLPASGSVEVRRAGAPREESNWLHLSGHRPDRAWPAAVAGLYTVRATGDAVATYAVNWPREESDLEPITLDEIRNVLGTQRVRLGGDSGPSGRGSVVAKLLSARHVLAALLLGLFVAEYLMAAGRARRQDATAGNAGVERATGR